MNDKKIIIDGVEYVAVQKQDQTPPPAGQTTPPPVEQKTTPPVEQTTPPPVQQTPPPIYITRKDIVAAEKNKVESKEKIADKELYAKILKRK